MVIRLFIDSQDGKTHEEIVLNKARFTIGRKAGNDLYIGRPEISGNHAELTFDNGEYYITDLGSTNGTLLNGAQLLANQRYLLQNQDLLTFGPIRVTYVVEHDTMETMLDSEDAGYDANGAKAVAPHRISTGTEEHLKPEPEAKAATKEPPVSPSALESPKENPPPAADVKPPPAPPSPVRQIPDSIPENSEQPAAVEAHPAPVKTSAVPDYLWIAIGVLFFLAAIGFVLFLILGL